MPATYTEVHYEGTDREEVVTRYANGVTYVEHCTHRDASGEAATEMVTPYSLCAKHAAQERADRERRNEYLNSPEFQAILAEEAAAEHAYELRAAFGAGVEVVNVITGERSVS